MAVLRLLLLADLCMFAVMGFFVQQGFNADSSSFGPKMSTERIGTREPAATAPLPAPRQIPPTYEFLLSGV